MINQLNTSFNNHLHNPPTSTPPATPSIRRTSQLNVEKLHEISNLEFRPESKKRIDINVKLTATLAATAGTLALIGVATFTQPGTPNLIGTLLSHVFNPFKVFIR